MEPNFDDIRPFRDGEIQPALNRIAESPSFYAAMNWLFPEQSTEQVKQLVKQVKTTYDFQKLFMHKAIRKIVEKSSDGLTCSGFEEIDKNIGYLYVSNHRDIFLDSGLLQILLFEREIDTTQITFGSNLMQDAVADICRVNKMFQVERGGSRREMYESSVRLSEYIRYTIKQNISIWIAQRNGRTKDGHDLTQTGILKMFSQSAGDMPFVDSFNELNIAPIATSYEYEPCDMLKTRELYLLEKEGSYDKKEGEDLNSVLEGIKCYKGRIHMAITPKISLDELKAIDGAEENFNKKVELLTALIDDRIYSAFKLWPTNYIAADLYSGTGSYGEYYTLEDKSKFISNMTAKLDKLTGERDTLQEIFLKIYANPVFDVENNRKNKRELTTSS